MGNFKQYLYNDFRVNHIKRLWQLIVMYIAQAVMPIKINRYGFNNNTLVIYIDYKQYKNLPITKVNDLFVFKNDWQLYKY